MHCQAEIRRADAARDEAEALSPVTGSATAIGVANQLDADGFSDVDGLAFTFTATTAVPEPSTYAMLLGGLGCGAAVFARRRRRGVSTR